MSEYKIDYCHHDSVTAESRQECIKREDAYKYIDEHLEEVFTGQTIAEALKKIISKVSTADVVDVVRCKDCKRGGWRVSGLDNKTKGYRCAIHAVLGVDFGDNGYCSYGEREEK